MTRDDLALAFARIAAEASVAVMKVYETDFTTFSKADRSPVTEADRRAEAIILQRLQALLPETPVLAEEQYEAGVKLDTGDRFVLVDPVDGTKEFIHRRGEFTVNIALVEEGAPGVGAGGGRVRGTVWYGGERAFRAPIENGAVNVAEGRLVQVRKKRAGAVKAVMSRSHADEKTKAFAEAEGVTEIISAGSSLKFCLVAEGEADLYPRFGPTMEWDTAAGHAVLIAAGGSVETPEGGAFLYGKREADYRNGGFVARGR